MLSMCQYVDAIYEMEFNDSQMEALNEATREGVRHFPVGL